MLPPLIQINELIEPYFEPIELCSGSSSNYQMFLNLALGEWSLIDESDNSMIYKFTPNLINVLQMLRQLKLLVVKFLKDFL